MRRVKFLLVGVAILAGGCATQKTLEATGGSRADGVIELAFEMGGFEKPVIDWNQAQTTAVQRCNAWGYNNAERFGGQKVQCTAWYQGSCVRQTVIIPYQCINT